MGRWGWCFVLLLVGCGRPVIDRATVLQDLSQGLLKGQTDLVQTLAQRAFPLRDEGPVDDLYLELNLCHAEILLDQGLNEKAQSVLNEPALAQSNVPPIVASRELLLGFLALRQGDLNRAIVSLDKATTLAEATGRLRVLAMVRNLQAFIAMSQKQDATAETHYLESLRISRTLHEVPYRIKSVVNLALIYIRQARYDEAVTILKEMEPLLPPGHEWAASLNLNLGIALSWLGRFGEAEGYLQKAIDMGQGKDKNLEQLGRGAMGNLFSLRGDNDKALAYYKEAFALAESQKDSAGAGMWVSNVTQVLLDRRDFLEVPHWIEQERRYAPADGDPEHELHNRRTEGFAAIANCTPELALDLLADVLIKADALKLPSLSWEARVAMGGCFVTMGKVEETNRYYQDAIDVIDESPVMEDPSNQVVYFSRLLKWHRVFVDELIDQGETKRALEVVESSRARELRFRGPSPIYTVADFEAAAKNQKQVFLAYWVTDTMSYLWVVNQGGIHMFNLPNKEKINSWVAAHQAEVVNRLGDPVREGGQAGELLYRYLIEPALPYLPKDCHVVLVPDGPLHNLAFETLPVPGAQGHYWLEDVTLSITPSLNLFLQTKDRLGPRDGVLIVGNPAYRSPAYPRLAASAQEIALIQAHFQGKKQTVLAGDSAERDSFFAAQPETFPVIHFATHAEVNAQAPMDSAVILSPAKDVTETKLYARDILAYPLAGVRLVTLSACDSAGANAYAGEGLVGFAWAFLWSGVEQVVAANWNVDDGAAVLLMDHFYAELAKGAEPADALHRAKLSLLHSDSRYRIPYFWGAFQVYSR